MIPLLYFIIAFIIAVLTARYLGMDPRARTRDDEIEAALFGLMGGILWPVVILIVAVRACVKVLNRLLSP